MLKIKLLLGLLKNNNLNNFSAQMSFILIKIILITLFRVNKKTILIKLKLLMLPKLNKAAILEKMKI